MDVCTSCISAKKKRERKLTLSGWNITGKFCEAAEPCGRKKAASCPGHEQPPGYEAWQDWLATWDEGGEWPNSGPGAGHLTGCSVACLRFTEHRRLALVSKCSRHNGVLLRTVWSSSDIKRVHFEERACGRFQERGIKEGRLRLYNDPRTMWLFLPGPRKLGRSP